MAHLTTSFDLTREATRARLEQTFGDYSSFLQKAPVFVDWYSLDEDATSMDKSLHGVEEMIGSESPARYTRIVNFPIHLTTPLPPIEPQLDEDGVGTDRVGEAYVVPGLARPKPYDLLVFVNSDVETESVYQVTTASRTRPEGRTFHKISFKLYKRGTEWLELQHDPGETREVVEDREGRPGLSTTEDSVVLQTLAALMDMGQALCRRNYVDSGSGGFRWRDPAMPGRILWDRTLEGWIEARGLLRPMREHRNSSQFALPDGEWEWSRWWREICPARLAEGSSVDLAGFGTADPDEPPRDAWAAGALHWVQPAGWHPWIDDPDNFPRVPAAGPDFVLRGEFLDVRPEVRHRELLEWRHGADRAATQLIAPARAVLDGAGAGVADYYYVPAALRLLDQAMRELVNKEA